VKIAMHIPCYINELFPEVARDSVLLLRKLGFEVSIPKNQTCCGEPFINNGFDTELPHIYDEIFKSFDYIVSCASSCVNTIHSQNINISTKTHELIDFLYMQGFRNLIKNHPPLILHNSCQSMKYQISATPSELNIPHLNKVKEVLGCELIEAKKQECCGFGGSYSLMEGEISYVMGKEKLEDLLSGWKYDQTPTITSVDMSCLMHLKGIADKEKMDINFEHVSTVLLKGLS